MTSFWHSDPNISTLNTSSSCIHNPPETFEMSAVSTNWQYEPPTGSEPGSVVSFLIRHLPLTHAEVITHWMRTNGIIDYL